MSLVSICHSPFELVDPDCTLTWLPTAVRSNVSLANYDVPDKDVSAAKRHIFMSVRRFSNCTIIYWQEADEY